MVDWSNPKEVKDYHKNYRETHKEEKKKYREDHKEKLKANAKKYYETNREKIRVRKKRYRETHKEQIKAYHKKYDKTYREKNKEKIRAFKREYSAKYFVTKFYKYVGVCFCEKCGSKGYKKYKRRYNKKTENYSKIMTYVYHQHREDGKTVHDGVCYIGMGEL